MASARKALPSIQKMNSAFAPAPAPKSVEKALPVVLHRDSSDPFNSSRIHRTTERALILRNKPGDPILFGKISGQEKLALLANELMTTAIQPRLDIDEMFRIADSQLWLHLWEILNLKDSLFFYDDIMVTIESRFESSPDRNGQKPALASDPQFIASVVGSRLHNLYLLAACWRVVKNVIKELKAMHLDVSEINEQLTRNIKLREKYLTLYDMVTTLRIMGQQRVANIAAATPHYAGYFRFKNVATGQAGTEAQLEFNCQNQDSRQLRQAHKSFIDAIVLEVVLPHSQYPPHVLMTLLRNAVDDCKKEEVRFSQALWDAIGDFSVATRALDMVEGPLLSEQGQNWLKNSALSKEYVDLLRMQDSSEEVTKHSSTWGTCFSRLIDTKDKACLDLLWKTINESYRTFTGKVPEALWSLQGELQRLPQWSSTFNADVESDGSEDLDRALVRLPGERKVNNGVNRLRITDRLQMDSDSDSMPSLKTLSDYTENEAEIDTNEQSYDNESDYGQTEDELYQEDLHEALNQFDSLIQAVDAESYKNSSNPFVKMFANLKDRFFAANPTLRLDGQNRRPNEYLRQVHSARTSLVSTTDSHPATPSHGSFEVTIEEIEDDEDVHPAGKKRKKKKKKKKILQNREMDQRPSESENEEFQDVSAKSPTAQARNAPPDQSTPSAKPPESPRSRISSPRQSPSTSKLTGSPNKLNKPSEDFGYSQLALPTPEAAQSARSYLQAENLISEKSKIKRRPAFSTKFFRNPGEEKESKKGEDKEESTGPKFFAKIKKINLSRKAGDLMHRLIGNADGKTHAKKPMKWDDFVKVMRAMGFTYNPSTAGSSVRFDPPNPKDSSVTFHKPHPDTTLQRHHLREFGKKLIKTYGWREEMFSTFGIEENETD